MKRVKNWLLRNARPLDLAMYMYLFEGGSRENVLNALSAYQNADGGFAYALEADSWCEVSSPIQTWRATQILLEVGETDKNSEIVKSTVNWLRSGSAFKDGRWQATVPENNAYPHAPWWTHTDSEAADWGDNPTSSLAAFLKIIDPSDDLADGLLNAARERFMKSDKPLGADGLNCVYSLVKSFNGNKELEGKYVECVLNEVERDTSKWRGYACRPSSVVRDKQNPACEPLADLIKTELEYIKDTRNKDGVWDIRWAWAGYDKEFHISENWWKSQIAIENLQFLREFGGKL